LGERRRFTVARLFRPIKKCRRWRIGGYTCSQRTCFTRNPGINEMMEDVHQTQRQLWRNGKDVLNITAIN
jgi:hypothetical protein